MKPNQYNPTAREAFGRSLIDIGVAIFKNLMLVFTVIPLAALLKAALGGDETDGSVIHGLLSLSGGSQVLILGFIIASFVIGHIFRKEGLRHLHELEQDGDVT